MGVLGSGFDRRRWVGHRQCKYTADHWHVPHEAQRDREEITEEVEEVDEASIAGLAIGILSGCVRLPVVALCGNA